MVVCMRRVDGVLLHGGMYRWVDVCMVLCTEWWIAASRICLFAWVGDQLRVRFFLYDRKPLVVYVKKKFMGESFFFMYL